MIVDRNLYSVAFICDGLGGEIERTWAYLTIKKLLDKAKYDAVSSAEAQKMKDEALQLSLKVIWKENKK